MGLPIRTRRTLTDDETTLSRSVPCPIRGEVPLETCSTCDRVEHIDRDHVQCEAAQPPPDRAPLHLAKRVMASVAERTPIWSLMSREVVCVTPELELDTLSQLFLDRSISAAPVVGPDGFPIGMVTKTDLVRDAWENGGASAEPMPVHRGDLGDLKVVGPCGTVKDVMTPLAFTLRDRQPLSSAAAMMSIEGVHHLPVVDDHGRVVGMLSALDFAKWLAGS
jgi:CBS-domain-containing membrane protein